MNPNQMIPDDPMKPGSWWVIAEGPYLNRKAYINAYGNMMIFTDWGDYDTLLLAERYRWPLARKMS